MTTCAIIAGVGLIAWSCDFFESSDDDTTSQALSNTQLVQKAYDQLDDPQGTVTSGKIGLVLGMVTKGFQSLPIVFRSAAPAARSGEFSGERGDILDLDLCTGFPLGSVCSSGSVVCNFSFPALTLTFSSCEKGSAIINGTMTLTLTDILPPYGFALGANLTVNLVEEDCTLVATGSVVFEGDDDVVVYLQGTMTCGSESHIFRGGGGTKDGVPYSFYSGLEGNIITFDLDEANSRLTLNGKNGCTVVVEFETTPACTWSVYTAGCGIPIDETGSFACD